MTHDEATHFASDWAEAWNRHDIDAVLAHYADDFEMTTPMIQRVLGIESGTLKEARVAGELPVFLSVDLYRAVIEGGVRTPDQWHEWQQTHETGVLTDWKPTAPFRMTEP